MSYFSWSGFFWLWQYWSMAMTDSQLQTYVQQMAEAMIESHGDKVRITLNKTESGWIIEITDPDRDH